MCTAAFAIGQFGVVYRGILIKQDTDQLPTPVAIKTLSGEIMIIILLLW